MRCNERDCEGFGPSPLPGRKDSVTAAAALFGRRTGAGMASEVKAGKRGRRRTQNDLESVQTAALSERSGDSSTILPRQQPEPPNVSSPSSATTSPRYGRRQFIPRHTHSLSDQSATEKLVLEAEAERGHAHDERVLPAGAPKNLQVMIFGGHNI